jgi:DNA-binding transcriptional regulator YhcF (GntR family)
MYTEKRINISKDELQWLSKNLPFGAKAQLATHLNLHRNTITRVFQGKELNEDVIEAACEMVVKRSKRVHNIKQRISDLKSAAA